jgi:hypothetical protein
METKAAQETFVPNPSPYALNADVARSKLRWGAIFGGAVAAIGIATMLYALGLALGLSWIDPRNPGNLRSSGIFSAIWMLGVSLIALFVGGYVAARGAGTSWPGLGALHGLVVWGLSVVAGAWLIGNVASAVLHGGAAMSRPAAGSFSSGTAPSAPLRGTSEGLGVSPNDVQNPGNERLPAANRPDGTRSYQPALEAAEASSKAFWVLFGELLVGMVSAIGGAAVGSDTGRRPVARVVSPTRATTQDAPRGEVYP